MLNVGLTTFSTSNEHNEALQKIKEAEHEQIMLKARIIKLKKEEEEANKKIQ